MAQASIPVDLFNPGQVFACMGFLEVAHVLLANAEGGFDWTNGYEARFKLYAGEEGRNPFDAVLDFLVNARIARLAPEGYEDPQRTKSPHKKKGSKRHANEGADEPAGDGPVCPVVTFPSGEADRFTLPLRFEQHGRAIDVSHWCDASSRNPFKLFAGQQRSGAIAQQMCACVRKLWNERRAELTNNPLGLTVPLGGSSYKFDARKAWTAIDAGYSPDEQAHVVEASPVVELLAAIGLEHARPDEFETRKVRYGAWGRLLPPALARPVLGGSRIGVPTRIFRFTLDLSGKNKVVTFADEEI